MVELFLLRKRARHSTRKQDIWHLSNFEREALQIIADCPAPMCSIRRRINNAIDESHHLKERMRERGVLNLSQSGHNEGDSVAQKSAAISLLASRDTWMRECDTVYSSRARPD